MDSSHYNPSYAQWNDPYSSHPPTHALPPPPPPPRQSHPERPDFYGQSSQSGGQIHDYLLYSHRQDIPSMPAVSLPSSYHSQHLPPPPQHEHLPYIPQHVSHDYQRISQPSSSNFPGTDSRDITQSDWDGYKEKQRDSWAVGSSQGRINVGQNRVDADRDRNYQYDIVPSSRDSLGVSVSRGLDGTSRSRDEFRRLGYERKDSGATRIESKCQDRDQLKSESVRHLRGLDEGNRGLSSTVGYGGGRYGVTVNRDVTRSSASYDQRWDEAHNGGRTLYPRKKDGHYHSEVEQYVDRGRREESKESNRTPWKQLQKKSALLRLETPRSYQKGRENDQSRHHSQYGGKRFNSKSFRGKEHLGHSGRGLVEKQRGRTPMDLDVTFKSNILVAKPVASPTRAVIRSGVSVTPRSSKARRTLISDKDEKASVTEGNGKLRTQASVSEVSRQFARQTTAPIFEKKPDSRSTSSSSDCGDKLNKARFVEGFIQDSKLKITDTGHGASTHGSVEKVSSTLDAAENISSFFEVLKEAKDDTNVEHDSNIEVRSIEEDVIDGLEKTDIAKTETRVNTSPIILPISWSTAADHSGSSEGGIHFTHKSMCGVGSQLCEDEDMEWMPSPTTKVNTGFEERKTIGSSIGSLGYAEKGFEKSSLDASIYFNCEETSDHVLVKSDNGVIEDGNKGTDKNIDSWSPENDSSKDLPKGLVSSASLEVANVSGDLDVANNSVSRDLDDANNSVSGDFVNTNSFTVGTYSKSTGKSPDIILVSQVESKNLLHYENTVNPSVENVSRKEFMETTPLNNAAETTVQSDNLDSEEHIQACLNGTFSSLTKVAVKGSSDLLPVERADGCSRRDESDLAMAVSSKVCKETLSAERLVPDEDLGMASHNPTGIPSEDQFGGSDGRGLEACLSEPNDSLCKDITDDAGECLVERDVSLNLAIGMNGMSGSEPLTDAGTVLRETQPCSTVCTLLPEDHFQRGSSNAIGSQCNLSMDKILEKDPSRVSSCLVSGSSVSPCHISPLVVLNSQIQNKTSIQDSNYNDLHCGIMHKENSCAENIQLVSQEEKPEPSNGISKHRTLGTDTISVSGHSALPCDSLSSSPRQSLRTIQSEIHVAAMVDENSNGKEKPEPSGGTAKCRTPGTNIVAVSGDSTFPRDSLPSSPRLYRQIRSEIHVASVVDETSKYKVNTKPSGGTSKYRTLETEDIAVSGDSVSPCDSLSSLPGLNFRQIRSEIHTAMVDDTSKVKESQKEDNNSDTFQERMMVSRELTQRGSTLAQYPCLGQIFTGADVSDLVEKPSDVTSEKHSPNCGKTDMFDGEALSSDGKVSGTGIRGDLGTGICGDLGVRVSRSHSHGDAKFALTHVKDRVVSVSHWDSQGKKLSSSRYEIQKRENKSIYSTQKSYARSLPFVSDTKKDANTPTRFAKHHTWRRQSDASPSSFVDAKPMPSTLSTEQKFPKVTAQSGTSYVRKGNSLLRKASNGSPGVAPGMPPSAIQLNRFTVEEKSRGSISMVDVDNTSFRDRTGDSLVLERQSNPPSDSSTSKASNAIATSSGKYALSYSMDHLSTGVPESIMDSATSEEANVPYSGEDTLRTSDTVMSTGYASDCQQKRNPPKFDSSKLKRMVNVKRKANHWVAASDIHGASKSKIHPSDSYFKRSKNQLVRNSESRAKQSISLPDDALDSRAAANMVSERPSSSAFSDSGVMRPYRQSKCSLVWTQNDPQPRMPIANTRHQMILPQLVPWKRVTYWRRLMNSGSAFRNGSFSNISRKLSMMRKRHAVYTRSTNGYSLRKSKVLSIGGPHLKWSKSIERDSRKANEEATLAVAAFTKKESEKHSGQSKSRRTSRNDIARERIFRFGSLRYKMDSSRRTLQRISDVDSTCSGPSENGKGTKRPFIPKRFVIGNEEYVRVGNGNQLVRDPKKRTRTLANEKVRWSLHNVRLRLAKKKKYCQFFTRFGKCTKDDGKCPYVHDPSKIAVCTKFLNGLCTNANCKLTHKVIPERMPDCSYYLQGLCNNKTCPYRHVHVNPSAAICDGFLKGYCSDGDECRKKHSYTCPVFEATGSCSLGSKCKLHHPKKQRKGKKRKRPSEPSQKNARGRYFGSLHKVLSDSEPMVVDRRSTEVFGMEGLDYINLGAAEYACDENDPGTEHSISSDSEAQVSIYDLIRPVALMQQ